MINLTNLKVSIKISVRTVIKQIKADLQLLKKMEKIDCTPLKTLEKDYTELVYWCWQYFGGVVICAVLIWTLGDQENKVMSVIINYKIWGIFLFLFMVIIAIHQLREIKHEQ